MFMSPASFTRKTLVACVSAALAACSTMPAYQKPDVAIPAHYAGAAGWAPAVLAVGRRALGVGRLLLSGESRLRDKILILPRRS